MDFKKLANRYKTELLDSVLPFWLKNSIDKEYGGYFSCLDRDGSVYDTDKFIWLQGREVWLFSMLCNKLGKKQEWLDAAITRLMTETDEERRKALYAEILGYVHDEGVYIPLTYSRTKAVHVRELKGVSFGVSQYEIPFEKMYF